jgi:hypothetical protein
VQAASAKVWADEDHVIENRRLYAEKYAIADDILGHVPGYMSPEAGFFLWLPVTDGEAAALKLWQDTGVRVLPGAYLGRETNGENPGSSVGVFTDIDFAECGIAPYCFCHCFEYLPQGRQAQYFAKGQGPLRGQSLVISE